MFVNDHEPIFASLKYWLTSNDWLQDSGSRIWIYALTIDTDASGFFHIQDCNFCSSYRGSTYSTCSKELMLMLSSGQKECLLISFCSLHVKENYGINRLQRKLNRLCTQHCDFSTSLSRSELQRSLNLTKWMLSIKHKIYIQVSLCMLISVNS